MDIAIVTGASSGLGRALTKHIDACGLDEIWVNSRRGNVLEMLRQEMKTGLRIFAGDISREETLAEIGRALNDERPVVKYFVYAAGFGKIGAPGRIPPTEIRGMAQVNAEAAVLLTELCLPYMARGSRIAEVCSVAAFQPIPYFNVYAATKAFLYHYARALRAEVAPAGITVTAVCPYWIKDTAFISRARGGEDRPYFQRFPFAVTTEFAANKAWKDIQAGKGVSTQGWFAALDRAAARFLPDKVVMAASRFLFG